MAKQDLNELGFRAATPAADNTSIGADTTPEPETMDPAGASAAKKKQGFIAGIRSK